MEAETKKFQLRVYDNFHYMDESDVFDSGHYKTYADAIIAAKEMVDEFFERHWKPGITIDELIDLFISFGEDPSIIPDDAGEHARFSAFTYASVSAEMICNKMKKE